MVIVFVILHIMNVFWVIAIINLFIFHIRKYIIANKKTPSNTCAILHNKFLNLSSFLCSIRLISILNITIHIYSADNSVSFATLYVSPCFILYIHPPFLYKGYIGFIFTYSPLYVTCDKQSNLGACISSNIFSATIH